MQPPTSRKSDRGKPKPNKPNVIHVSLSLREDVKLREAENAWRPTRLNQTGTSEEEVKTQALYKKVRSVLNKLTPQKFNTLVEQVRSLEIDTPERLQGVINLVFEKAVDEPSFSVEYALMCKELGVMEVAGANNQDSSINFKKLIITRCQKEFEKNPIDDVERKRKLKEIDEVADPVSILHDVFILQLCVFNFFFLIKYFIFISDDDILNIILYVYLLGEEEADALGIRRGRTSYTCKIRRKYSVSKLFYLTIFISKFRYRVLY